MSRPDRHWSIQPVAAALVRQTLDDALARVPAASALATRLRDDLGVRLVDVLDHIRVGNAALRRTFQDAGWEADPMQDGVYRNPTATDEFVAETVAGMNYLKAICRDLDIPVE